MKALSLPNFLLVPLAVGALSGTAQTSPATRPAAGLTTPAAVVPTLSADARVLSHLQDYRADHVRSLREGQPNAMLRYYAESVRLMPEHQLTLLGKANAESYHNAFAARFEVRDYRREPIDTVDLGSRVLELGNFALTVARRGRVESHPLAGKYMDIWERDRAGALTLMTAAWNYDHATEIADALRFPELPGAVMAFQPRAPVRDRVSFDLAALNQLLERTVTQHDAKVWAQFYADDAILLHSYSAPYIGRQAIDEFLENHVKQMPIFEKLDVRTDRIDDLGDYVIEYASHVANWKNGDASGVNTGKNIRVWQRGPDRALRLFRTIGMYE